MLPQICTASAEAHVSCPLKQMQHRFAVIFGTRSIRMLKKVGPVLVVQCAHNWQMRSHASPVITRDADPDPAMVYIERSDPDLV